MDAGTQRSISRRKFGALTTSVIVGSPLLHATRFAGSLTAQEVANRIRKSLPGEWKPDSIDGFKAGDPSTLVTGIVTTALASMDVLRMAVKQGSNLIITCEPTYFSKGDVPTPPVPRLPGGSLDTPAPPPPPDPVFRAKAAFIQGHGLVIWRLKEHWLARTTNPFRQGIADVLDWSKFADRTSPARISIPEVLLDTLALQLKTRLKSRGGIRIVGDPKLRIRTVGLLPGSTPIQASIEMLPHVDAIIAGEVREWESVEYVRDTVALGGKKALILLGRIVSEDPGMKVCAEWLKEITPELNATWYSAGDPYWRPRP